MKTGKMKQALYIFAFTALLAPEANAQLASGAMASSMLAKPVLLSDVNLKASFANNGCDISWQATSAIKVRRYELEKSIDGESFFYITSFSGSEKFYSAKDNNLFSSNNYYRLKIVDADGNFLYSNIETISTKASADAIRILPARISNKLYVWVPANTSISCASVSGADGKMQRKAIMNSSANTVCVDISGLCAGVYNLSVQTSKGETVKMRFIKP